MDVLGYSSVQFVYGLCGCKATLKGFCCCWSLTDWSFWGAGRGGGVVAKDQATGTNGLIVDVLGICTKIYQRRTFFFFFPAGDHPWVVFNTPCLLQHVRSRLPPPPSPLLFSFSIALAQALSLPSPSSLPPPPPFFSSSFFLFFSFSPPLSLMFFFFLPPPSPPLPPLCLSISFLVYASFVLLWVANAALLV